MSAVEKISAENEYAYLSDQLIAQKEAFLKNPLPSAEYRIANLNKLKKLVMDNSDEIIQTISMDFSNRAESETLLAEVFPLLDAIEYSKKRLKKWMKTSKRKAPDTIKPSTAEVMYQPLGVIGIVVPWNFPMFLGLSPLISAFAAGNRAMLKMSEFAPRTGELLKKLLETAFGPDEVAVFNGEVDVAAEFTRLPFDHLVFTGATPVGKIVMRAAAENLTPVTLELGGKSPVIIHESFPIEEAAKRIAFGKGMNAGQICVSPDYILCPRSQVDAFAQAFVSAMSKSFPSLKSNSDYTAIINDRQLSRLQSYVKDAEEKGAKIITVNPSDESFEGTRKMPMTLALDTTEDMLVDQEEIFGPLIAVKPYDTLDEAIKYVNDRPRPLALYYFDWDKDRANDVLARTHSGGACINDTLSHVSVDDAPFGGIGPSGMGHYHGKEGFLNFSKAKTVIRKGKIDVTKMVSPPWGKPVYNVLIKFLWFKFKKLSK